jgi:hypothetical protein
MLTKVGYSVITEEHLAFDKLYTMKKFKVSFFPGNDPPPPPPPPHKQKK